MTTWPRTEKSSAEEPNHPSVSPATWVYYFQTLGRFLTNSEEQIIRAATASIRVNFPGAMNNMALMALVDKALVGRGFTADDTLFGGSFCPDEICHGEGDLPQLMFKRFGELFSLSGLGGIPFTGKTGFGAFATHIPEGGKVFINFAPHVAISPDGEVGLYQRFGQSELTTACGAFCGALEHVQSGGEVPEQAPDDDMQVVAIMKHVHEHRKRIESHPKGEQVGLCLEAFEMAKQRMLGMIDVKQVNGGDLALLGGVQINMPAPLPGFFLPLYFQIHAEGKEPVDLIHLLDEKYS